MSSMIGIDPATQAMLPIFKDLAKTIEQNIKETSEQNKKMGHYTFWIFIMTIVITLSTFAQLWIVFNSA